jgi:hypothetical protein
MKPMIYDWFKVLKFALTKISQVVRSTFDSHFLFKHSKLDLPVTVAELSKAWTVFACSDAVIVGSNPTWGMDVYMFVRFSVFVLSCV